MWLPVCFIFLCVSQVMAANFNPPVVVDATCKDCLADKACDQNGDDRMIPSISMCVKVTCSSGGEATVCGHAIFNKTRKCVDDQYEPAKICTEPPVTCPALNNQNKGTVSTSGQTVGSTATYVCDTCYSLNGNNERVCQDDGSWSGVEPTCEGAVPNDIWIGLSDLGTEGAFEWAHSMTPLDDNQADWHTNEPNNQPAEGDCVRIDKSFNYKWRDMRCSETYGFLCEYELL